MGVPLYLEKSLHLANPVPEQDLQDRRMGKMGRMRVDKMGGNKIGALVAVTS